MWPFSRKAPDETGKKSTSLASALDQLAGIGVRVRPDVSPGDLLLSLGGSMESPVDWIQLLCVLGSDAEHGDLTRVSDDVWHFDAECIAGHGDYKTVINRFVTLAKGTLPLVDIRDQVDIAGGRSMGGIHSRREVDSLGLESQ